MSYMILISGLPAGGKTSFCNYLSIRMGIPAISKDSIKEILFDTLGFQSREEKVRLGFASSNIMYHLAENSIKLNKPVILENNFENHDKPKLCDLLERYHYSSITVQFGGDLEVIYKRFIERNHSSDRHLGHITNQSYPIMNANRVEIDLSYEQYCDMVIERGIRGFNIGGENIFIDTTDLTKVNYEEIYKEILSKIQKY